MAPAPRVKAALTHKIVPANKTALKVDAPQDKDADDRTKGAEGAEAIRIRRHEGEAEAKDAHAPSLQAEQEEEAEVQQEAEEET